MKKHESDLIQDMKRNNIKFGCLSNAQQRSLSSIGKTNCVIYDEQRGWQNCTNDFPFAPEAVYRVHKDYITFVLIEDTPSSDEIIFNNLKSVECRFGDLTTDAQQMMIVVGKANCKMRCDDGRWVDTNSNFGFSYNVVYRIKDSVTFSDYIKLSTSDSDTLDNKYWVDFLKRNTIAFGQLNPIMQKMFRDAGKENCEVCDTKSTSNFFYPTLRNIGWDTSMVYRLRADYPSNKQPVSPPAEPTVLETIAELKKVTCPFYQLSSYEQEVLKKVGRYNCECCSEGTWLELTAIRASRPGQCHRGYPGCSPARSRGG